MLNEMKKEFLLKFGVESYNTYFSPGRVNLIGEHIDYNGGHVLPCALDIGTYAIVSKRQDNNILFYSMNFSEKGIIKCDLNNLEYNKNHDWANYLKGVIFFMQKNFKKSINHGLNILIYGNIPNSSGLSSSSSIELLMGVIARDCYELNISQLDLVKLGKNVENEYIGVSCGIMDQFAIGMCKKNNVILINTNTTEYEHVPLELGKYKIVICNTMIKRQLTDSKYNERCKECQEGLYIINKKFKAKYICDISLKDLQNVKSFFYNETIYKRVKHVVNEENRTIEAVKALKKGDLLKFGHLLNESHLSLKNDYEVSCEELDIMTKLSLKYGAIGSRMTGAGFGGCTVSIVPQEKLEEFKYNIKNEYKKLTGVECEIYVAVSGNGAKSFKESVIGDLINYGIDKKIVKEEDRVYIGNKIANAIGEKNPSFYSDNKIKNLTEILNELIEIAIKNNIINENDVTNKDILMIEIMGIVTPMPSQVIEKFFKLYKENKELATSYFYNLCKDVYYIRTDKIEKNIKWTSNTKVGNLKITINLSKPEKDPKAIAQAKNIKSLSYPKCLLCRENEGFKGNLKTPARQNIRLIPITLEGEQWFLQYSPYSYFNEHAIILKEQHVPMKISKGTFKKILKFLQAYPHYFIGSNADLPIVGGSILSHDHYQGGKDVFPIEDAKPWHKFEKDNVKYELINWPMSTIRIKGKDVEKITNSASHILNKWILYSDESVDIIGKTDVVHNTITPIGRFKKGLYELDLVLRNNRVTNEYPFGIFHPHENLHNIKKENIGLIEVMGLAILPKRLAEELEVIEDILKNNLEIPEYMNHHKNWILKMQKKLVEEPKKDLKNFIKLEVGEVFADVLIDAGVFKLDEKGKNAFLKFINTI